MWLEEKLCKSSNINPLFGLCCHSGKVKLPLLPHSPQYLDELFKRRSFMENIRTINSTFTFTSMGCKVDTSLLDGRGPPCFRVSGEVCHRIGSLLPTNETHNGYAQLYICDNEAEIRNRLNIFARSANNQHINVAVVEALTAMLDNINPYVQVFRRARDVLQRDNATNLHIRILQSRGDRQYTKPTTNEIAALIVGDEANYASCRDIIVCKNDGRLQRIKETHPSYMPLQYPILFPYGTDGWRIGIPYASTSQQPRVGSVSMREFWSFRCQHRSSEGTTILQGGRLYNQLAVDCCATIEQSRLNYIRTHQTELRADLYQGLEDSIVAGDTDASAVGMRIVLPSSFTGGPRNMLQHYQDAIAICRTFGAPDFFVTFTCNPSWPEISRELQRLPRQHSDDRPDIVARVFRMKHKQLMKHFKEKKFFGNVVADINVIEFQKRGLPHSHISLTLAEQDKPITPDDIDQFICAEIPDKNADPLAYETVIKCMIHGPCGIDNPNAPCMVDGKCSKHYPKDFHDHTTINDNGFVTYRRRYDPNNVIFINGKKIDNRWVVPYNRDLAVEYNAHINVEKCAFSQLMKYMYKYFYKGVDRATIIVENNVQSGPNNGQVVYKRVDEIKQYLDCRYLSAVEAFWRIYDFELQKQNPHVERLRFHLPNQQFVVFNENDHLHNVLDREGIRDTMLTKWFDTNKNHVAARSFTYVEFPKAWVWKKDKKEWDLRKQGICVGRLPYAHPNSGELYYLRMLLYKVRGAQCYEDIRTFNGNLHATFKEACVARGLLDDDNEWHEAIYEASTWASPNKLRNMFCTMLMFSELTDPIKLWERNWKAMVDDFQYRVRREFRDNNICLDEADLKEWGLQEIECILNKNGTTLANFPPMPQPSSTSFSRLTNRLIREELDYDTIKEEQSFQSYFRGLNVDQLRVYNAVIQSYQTNSGGLFFVSGSGGTGKTYLWNTLISKFRSENKIVLSVASSGIAALLLPGGRTAHSRFKIPIELHEFSRCPIKTNTDLAQLIRKTSLIIWDEAPMMHQLGFKAVSETLKDLLKGTANFSPNKPFGGKLCILGGDFKQILPVVTKGGRAAIVAASLHKSDIWSQCKILHLKINMRLNAQNGSSHSIHELQTFAEWINNIGEGKIKGLNLGDGVESDWVEIPQKFLIKNENNSLIQLISSTYPDLINNFRDSTYLNLIPRITIATSASQTFCPMKRRQFPVKLAFAMTINKSQGQTLQNVGLYLPNPVFTHGQLYVALSRVTNPSGLKILICNKLGIPWNCTRNIVYREVLAAIIDNFFSL